MTKPASTPDYAKYLEKDPTDLQKHFAEWIEEKTGAKLEDADPTKIVQLAVTLYAHFQKSPENAARRGYATGEGNGGGSAKKAPAKTGPTAAQVAERQKATPPAAAKKPAAARRTTTRKTR